MAGKPWDPTEWNRNDGFSPGSPILTYVPGLDLQRTWGIDGDQLSDLSLSLRSDAPIVLLDATTGKRHPFWSELDTHPDTTDADRLLIIRPASNLAEGHRYVVVPPQPSRRAAVRRSRPGAVRRPADGQPHRRRRPASRRRAAPSRCSTTSPSGVGARPVPGVGLHRRQQRNLTERVLAMRDDAFAQLGDTNLADGLVQGGAPHDHHRRGRRPHARGEPRHGPHRHGHDHGAELPHAPGRDLGVVAGRGGAGRRASSPTSCPTRPTRWARPSVSSPTSRCRWPCPVRASYYGADGLPAVNPAQPTVEVPFDCHLPHQANVPHADGRADAMLYGHGLLGGRGESGGSSTEDLRLRGFAPCAVDWLGMATADLANVASILVDMSNFPSLPDRAQQGFVNFLYLGRALAHPRGPRGTARVPGRRRQPADSHRARSPTTATARAAIMGGALTALAPDFPRAKLGVPGDELLDAAEPQRRLGRAVRARSPTPRTRARSTSS